MSNNDLSLLNYYKDYLTNIKKLIVINTNNIDQVNEQKKLDYIEYFVNLEDLSFDSNINLSNIEFARELHHLKKIVFPSSFIDSISPLKTCINLEYLKLSDNFNRKIDILANLSNLKMKRDVVSENPRNLVVKFTFNSTNQFLFKRLSDPKTTIDNLHPETGCLNKRPHSR